MPEVTAEEYKYLLEQKEKDHKIRAKQEVKFYRNIKLESTCNLCSNIDIRFQDVLITSLPYFKPKTPDHYLTTVPTCSKCVEILSTKSHNQLIIQMKSMSRRLNRQPIPKRFRK